MLEGTKVNSTKTIHSRSNKDIGDVIETEWEITAKKVIAEPRAGDGNGPPRFGIYEYEVKPIAGSLGKSAPLKAARTRQHSEPSTGGTRREASSVPITVRRTS